MFIMIPDQLITIYNDLNGVKHLKKLVKVSNKSKNLKPPSVFLVETHFLRESLFTNKSLLH